MQTARPDDNPIILRSEIVPDFLVILKAILR
jgi:hypothetical protein